MNWLFTLFTWWYPSVRLRLMWPNYLMEHFLPLVRFPSRSHSSFAWHPSPWPSRSLMVRRAIQRLARFLYLIQTKQEMAPSYRQMQTKMPNWMWCSWRCKLELMSKISSVGTSVANQRWSKFNYPGSFHRFGNLTRILAVFSQLHIDWKCRWAEDMSQYGRQMLSAWCMFWKTS